MQGVRAREAGGFFVQTARHLPFMRGAAHGGDRRLAGGLRNSQSAGAPVGAVVPDSAAQSIRHPSRAARARIASHPLDHCELSDQTSGSETLHSR